MRYGLALFLTSLNFFLAVASVPSLAAIPSCGPSDGMDNGEMAIPRIMREKGKKVPLERAQEINRVLMLQKNEVYKANCNTHGLVTALSVLAQIDQPAVDMIVCEHSTYATAYIQNIANKIVRVEIGECKGLREDGR